MTLLAPPLVLRLENTLEVPNLIDIQRRSFEWLVDTEKGGLREIIDDVSPIETTAATSPSSSRTSIRRARGTRSQSAEKDLTYARR